MKRFMRCGLLIASTLIIGPRSLLADLAATRDAPEAVTTSDSIKVNLETTDFLEAVAGIKEKYFSSPMVGNLAERIETRVAFITVGIEGIDYALKVDGLSVTPGVGRLNTHVAIKDLNVLIRKVTFNSSGSSYCENIPISSGGEQIRSYSEVVPTANDGHLKIQLENTSVNLNSSNFVSGRPARCRISPVINWIVERALPVVVGIARSKISDALSDLIADKARDLGHSFDQRLGASLGLPIARAPLPKFKATIGLFPQLITMSPERLTLIAGTNFNLEPDNGEDGTDASAPEDMLLSQIVSSYVGVSEAFLTAAIREGNSKGLFGIQVNQNTFPEYRDYLTAELLQIFIPDAAERFPGPKPIAFQVTRARDAKVTMTDVDDGQIKLAFDGLVIKVSVDGAAYHEIELTGAFNLRLAFDALSNKLELKATGFEGLKAKGQFAEELEPRPRSSFDEAAFLDFVRTMEELLIGEDGRKVLSLQVPRVAIGSSALRAETAGVRDQYLLLGGKVTRL